MAIIKMSILDWLKVSDNPRQRDTVRHANRAKHLTEYSDTHMHVAMARLPNGDTYKLDGHTRAWLWSQGRLEAPPHVEVAVFDCANLDEVKALYTHFDNAAAVETKTDMVFGAFREIGYVPKSPLLCKGTITGGLRGAQAVLRNIPIKNASSSTGGMTVYDLIDEWAAEILALDDLHAPAVSFPAFMQTAFYITYRKHGDLAMGFWRAYLDNKGTKVGGRMDGAEALRQLYAARKSSKSLTGQDNQADLTARAVTCCEKWLDGEMLSVLKAADLTDYLKPAKKKETNPALKVVA